MFGFGRLSKEKGYDRLLNTLVKLKKEKILTNAIFNIIGEGEGFNSILNTIKENSLEDNIKLYGYKENPYPYMKNADMLILTSLYEGLGLVLYEALTLHVPCFSTKISEINLTLDGGKYGKIVENSEDGIYQGLKEILTDKRILEEYKENVKEYKYNKKYDILEKINNVIGEI